MNDHPKPIARYDCRPYHTGYMEKWDCGEFYAVEDIDPILAAKDARIAELEQKYIEALDFANEEMIKRGDEIKERARDNEQWRTAIEAKARELRERDGDNEDEDRAYRKIASELRALLEKKP